MRIQINLVEKWLGTAYDGHDVFINPSRAELAALLRASEYGDVRAFLDTNLYVWTSEILHHDFPNELLLPEDRSCAGSKGEKGRSCINLHIDRRGPFLNSNVYEDDEEARSIWARLSQHPQIRRLFGTVSLRLDEAEAER